MKSNVGNRSAPLVFAGPCFSIPHRKKRNLAKEIRIETDQNKKSNADKGPRAKLNNYVFRIKTEQLIATSIYYKIKRN